MPLMDFELFFLEIRDAIAPRIKSAKVDDHESRMFMFSVLYRLFDQLEALATIDIVPLDVDCLASEVSCWSGWDNPSDRNWESLREIFKDRGIDVAVFALLDAISSNPDFVLVGHPNEVSKALSDLISVGMTGTQAERSEARDIAPQCAIALACLRLDGYQISLPAEAHWWIENRQRLDKALEDIGEID